MNGAGKLGFTNSLVYLLYISVGNGEINFQKLRAIKPDWEIKEDEFDTRIFHSRYVTAISPCIRITPPPIQMQGIDRESFLSIPWPAGSERRSLFQQLVEEKSTILTNENIQALIRIFPEGIHSYSLCLNLDGEYRAEHLVALVNGLLDFDAKLIRDPDQMVRTRDIVDSLHHTLALCYTTCNSKKRGVDYETFSVIAPQQITPLLASIEDYFAEPYNQELFGVSIRRALQFRDIRADIPKRTQRNIALYKSDIVILNYHNLFVYAKEQLKIDFYLQIVETLKATAALLHYYDVKVYEQLRAISDFPIKASKRKSLADGLEQTRLDAIKALDTFRMLTALSATRAKIVLDHGTEVFEIRALVESINSKLRDIDSLLTSQYDLQLQKQIWLITIILGVVAIIATLLGVVGFDRLKAFFEGLFSANKLIILLFAI